MSLTSGFQIFQEEKKKTILNNFQILGTRESFSFLGPSDTPPDCSTKIHRKRRLRHETEANDNKAINNYRHYVPERTKQIGDHAIVIGNYKRKQCLNVDDWSISEMIVQTRFEA